MQICRENEAPPFPELQGAVVIIGNFDGLHRGHQKLFELGQSLTGPLVVLTFDPHPMQVLHPEKALKRLLPKDDLMEQLPKYGVDLLWVQPFTRGFSEQSAAQYLKTHLEEPFGPRHLVAGYDFAFGRDRQGSLESLEAWGAQFKVKVHVVEPLEIAGAPVSSRRLRDLISNQGAVREASSYLGRPFYLRGKVGRGAGRGAGIGVPTMNQHGVDQTLPLSGVYATRTRLRGQIYNSVTNVGWTPTFGEPSEIKIETHVFDQQLEARDQVIDVEFIERLRPEFKFASIDDLKNQIQTDILNAKKVLDETMDKHKYDE